MKRFIAMICSVFLFSLCLGCQQNCLVVVEGGKPFPPEMAGRWKSDYGDWIIVFQPNGQIEWAQVPLGNIQLRPNQVKRFPTRFGGKGIFEPGIWEVHYNPDIRELAVEIVVKHFLQDVGNHSMEGHQTDFLAGAVSEDFTEWNVDWSTQGRYMALIYEGWDLKETKEFFNAPEPVYRGTVMFRKVAEDQEQ
ncbi:MAG: hypothetical protein JW828_08095 [Sedimentisphaerales bacterium]|nr:hypothetical protein [Sedimentisphaerales bacterium]